MKNIFKKNQVIITALAIMIVIAGYLSFTNDDIPEDPAEVAGLEVVQNTDTDDTETPDDNEDADVETGNTEDEETEDEGTNDTDEEDDETTPVDIEDDVSELGDISDDDILEAAHDVTDTGDLSLDEDSLPGEAILVSTVIDQTYFISNKVDREQMRSRNRNTLREMIESSEVDESLKKEYTNKLIELTEISEKEKATEILLGARGFDDALVVINEGKADVIVNTPSLSDQQLAIIESVVKDKTDFSVENITIVPVVTEE